MADDTKVAELDPNAHTEVAGSNWTQTGAAGSTAPDVLDAGEIIGRYVIAEHIGSGGMGSVYRARDPRLERDVALKLIRGGRKPGARATERLLREATALAKLAHPNIVTVFDADAHEDQVFVAMELVHGVTLSEWLRDAERSRAEILDAFVAAGRGLSAAHEAGVVHRDFKPANVMVGNDGRVRVLDFGLARMHGTATDDSIDDSGGSSDDHDLTRTGAIMGTPAYMAPEQHGARPAGAPADQFALCVSLYEALYGEHPFGGESVIELAANAAEGRVRPAPKDSEVPDWLRAALLRGLSTSPDDRFGSVEELLDELTRDRDHRRRVARFAAVGVVLALIIAVVVGAAIARDGKSTDSGAAAAEVDPCSGVATMLDEVWNDTRRAALVSHIGDDRIAPAVIERVDAYAADWRDRREGVCRRRDEAYTQRVWCLEAAATAIDTLVDVLLSSDRTAFYKADAVLRSLPQLAECHRPAGAMDWTLAPIDEAGMAERTHIAQEIQKGELLRSSGRIPEAREHAHALLAEIDVITDVFARVKIARFAATMLADKVEAEKLLRRAIRDGLAVRDEEGVVKAYLDLIGNLIQQREFDAALQEYETASGHVDRYAQFASQWVDPWKWTPRFRGRLASHRGQLEVERGNWAASLPHYERAKEHWAEIKDESPDLYAEVLHNLANGYRNTGQYAKAIEHLDEAIEITQSIAKTHLYGYSVMLQVRGATYLTIGRAQSAIDDFSEAFDLSPDSGVRGEIAFNLAALHIMAEDYDAAAADLERARTEWSAFPAGHAVWALLKVHECALARERGALAEANTMCRAVAEELPAMFGAEHAYVGAVNIELGLLLIALEDYAGAVKNIDAGLAIYEKTTGTKTAEYGQGLAAKGRALARMGRTADAQAALIAAEDTFDAMSLPSHPFVVPALVDRAELLAAAGDASGATALVERALTIADVPGQLVSSRDIERARALQQAGAPAAAE